MTELETFKRLRKRFGSLIDQYPEDEYFKKEYDKFTRIINIYEYKIKEVNLEKLCYYCKNCQIEFYKSNSTCPKCRSKDTLKISIHK